MNDQVAGEALAATPWLTVKQAAARAQYGVKVIYAAVERHELKAVKKGNAFRIHVEWLDAWLDAGATVVNEDAPGPALVYQPRKQSLHV